MLAYLKREPGFYKGLFRLALPIVLQNLINNLLALADTFMVGGLGEHELAAVTLANNVFFVLLLMSFGIQSGAAILISQYWGKGDSKTINRVVGLGVITAGGISAVFVTIVMAFPGQIMGLTTIDTQLAAIGAEYLVIVAPAFLLNSLALMVLGAYRSMENARIGLVVLTVSMCVNTLLNYIFIYGNWGAPQMGVSGAALATLISRALEFALTVLYAFTNSRFRLDIRRMLRPGMVIARDFVKYALPVIINETLWGFGFTLYPIIVGHMNNAASSVSAYTVTLTIDRIMSALFFGIGSASAVIIGKHLGSGSEQHGESGTLSEEHKNESYRLGKVLLTVTGLTGLCGTVLTVSAALLLVERLLPVLFSMSAETAALSRTLLLINAINMPIRSLNFVIIVGVLRGGGDVKIAAVIDLLFLYAIGIPFAFVFGKVFALGVLFVFIGTTMEESLKCLVSLLRFRSRRWINNVTRGIEG